MGARHDDVYLLWNTLVAVIASSASASESGADAGIIELDERTMPGNDARLMHRQQEQRRQ